MDDDDDDEHTFLKQLLLHMYSRPLLKLCFLSLSNHTDRAVFVRFSLGGSEFRLAMTDQATIAGMEVAKLLLWNSLLNLITSVSIEAKAV